MKKKKMSVGIHFHFVKFIMKNPWWKKISI